MSIVFIPHTKKRNLATRMRSKLKAFENLWQLKFKVIGKIGDKLVDLLSRSDAWSDRDSDQIGCIVRESTGEEERKGPCRKRNMI